MNVLYLEKFGFTDHIHDTYIAGGTSWVQDMWNWLMDQIGRSGDTLVDIVADAFTGVSSALQTIKVNVGEFVDGVKSGAEFVKNSVLQMIVDAFGEITNLFIQAVKELIKIYENSKSLFKITQKIN